LTYQRHDAKTLSKEKLQALESIGCKTTKAHRERYVKDWEEKCNEIKKLNPHVRDRKVQMWLKQQRLLAVSDRLSPTRKQRLLDLGINLQPKSKKCEEEENLSTKANETKWMAMCSKLEKHHEKVGDVHVPRRYAEEPTNAW
jgi:hypothetical protein